MHIFHFLGIELKLRVVAMLLNVDVLFSNRFSKINNENPTTDTDMASSI